MRRVCALVLAGACLAACSPDGLSEALSDEGWTDEALRRALARAPLPSDPGDPTNRFVGVPEAEALGEALFHDPGLSVDGSVSCASCHPSGAELTDALPRAIGLREGPRRTQHLWNIGHALWLGWQGQADTLWAQALTPIESPAEMGHDRVSALRHVYTTPALRAPFEALAGPLPPLSDTDRFPPARPGRGDDPRHVAWDALDGADQRAVDAAFASLGKLIAAFEHTLRSPPSAVDAFILAVAADDLAGLDTLSPEERDGFRLFLTDGACHFCHTGPRYTDDLFHNLGLADDPAAGLGRAIGVARVLADPFNAAGDHSDDPEGPRAGRLRFLTTGVDQEGQHKTPSLRRVGLRAPYFHDGSASTLEEAVRFYAEPPPSGGVGHREELMGEVQLDEAGVAAVVAFLRKL